VSVKKDIGTKKKQQYEGGQGHIEGGLRGEGENHGEPGPFVYQEVEYQDTR